MFRPKGYSLVMWTVLFAVVSASVIFFLSPVKRAITSKTMRTADLLLWGTWGNATRQDGGRNKNQIGEMVFVSNSNQTGQVVEAGGNIQTKLDATSTSTSSYSSY